jgi:phenylacetate-coenzyme A ligase PaaK-like adenylate-forming protein
MSLVQVNGVFKSDAEKASMLAAVPVAIPVAETLASAQHSQLAMLAVACQDSIYAGFISAATGVPLTYPAKDRDQSNLAASVLASLMPNLSAVWTTPFWCMDANGVWTNLPHTVAQIQQVGLDGKAAIIAAINKNAALSAQVMQATDIAMVKLIVW